MYLIVGLGNPGKDYEKTRHNMGYDVLDRLKNAYNLEFKKKKNAYELKTTIQKKECILIKPTTYMNLSGICVNHYMNYYHISPRNIIVIHDDKDISPGNIRIKRGGSSAGHNGIKNIQEYVKDFVRVRVGIGKPLYEGDMIKHVISKVSDSEYENLETGIFLAEKAVNDILKNGVEYAMNKYNRKNNKGEENGK